MQPRTPIRSASHRRGVFTRDLLRGHSKVSKLNVSFLCCEDVRSFDVAMHHSLLMQVMEPSEDLRDVDPDQRLGESPN